MNICTPDICDEFDDKIEVLGCDFKSYGGKESFYGEVVTFKLDKNNFDLAQYLKTTDGTGKVMVVDVEKKYYAVVGDNLIKFAFDNNWIGIVVNGYVRDINNTLTFPVGLYAIGTCPRKFIPKQEGFLNQDVEIDGVKITAGDYIYVDINGVVISKDNLLKRD